MDWCRDVDYGNVPQWLALLVASVVAGFTIYGILTARKAYIADVKTREYAQARLIYGEIKSDYWMMDNETYELPLKDMPEYEYDRFIENDGPHVGDMVETPNGSHLTVTTQFGHYLRVVVVVVHNNSEEVISEVGFAIEFKHGSDYDYGVSATQLHFSHVAPQSKAHGVVVTDNRDGGPTRMKITFRDSAGEYWTRPELKAVRKTFDE